MSIFLAHHSIFLGYFDLFPRRLNSKEKCNSYRFSDDEDRFDGGDVAERSMNGVCARPIGPSDLLYEGATYCIYREAHFSLVVSGWTARAATLTGHPHYPDIP